MNPKLSLIAAVLAATVTSGCAIKHTDLETLASTAEIKPEVLPSTPFPLQGMLPEAGDYDRLRVYIEGYGPSTNNDPTPTNSLVARLAVDDKRPSVYLARPCQFVKTEACNPESWAEKRLGQEVIASYESALNGLKARFNNTQFELVGHADGGAIALLLAAERDDVVGVQTIAGNADTDAWGDVNKPGSLNGSKNPTEQAKRLSNIPQRHIVWSNETPAAGIETPDYMTQLQGKCTEIVEVQANYLESFEKPWKKLSGTPYACLTKPVLRKPSVMVGSY